MLNNTWKDRFRSKRMNKYIDIYKIGANMSFIKFDAVYNI